MRTPSCLLGAILLLLPGCAPERSGDDDRAAPKETAGAVDLRGVHSFNGRVARLADLKGKVVLIDFWATWCGPCIGVFPALRELYTQFKDDGLVVLGVTTYFDPVIPPAEENVNLERFVAKHELPYPMMVISLADWQKTLKAYEAQGIPTLVLLDRKGELQGRWVGASPQNLSMIRAAIKRLVAQK